MKAAAIQLDVNVGDVDHNLASSERLADQAGQEGAEWIILPEFFTTGIGFFPELESGSLPALPPDGEATRLLLDLAKRHNAKVGGSFLCRDDDGHVRNAFFLATPDGFAGRHDKDLPTMWENYHYTGGTDDGLIRVGGTDVGVALCLEYNRMQTVKRLSGKVDLVVGGSFVWDMPTYLPGPLRRALSQRNQEMANWTPRFAPLVGAPVVEATHCGTLECTTPGFRLPYRCQIGNGAKICDAGGGVLAELTRDDGPGIVTADIEPGRVAPSGDVDDRFWVHPLDPFSEYAGWRLQNRLGKRWYRRRGPGSRIAA